MTNLLRKTLAGIGMTLAAGLLPAQELRTAQFKGLINDYSPSTAAGGP